MPLSSTELQRLSVFERELWTLNYLDKEHTEISNYIKTEIEKMKAQLHDKEC
mgnify:CR=1 FL=1